ncbi:MAG: hypothetical protein FWD05_07040 [Oscillospiraceae bacterium]|nr:hypothetical protein [Oscillospiraceae bacterium]
MIIRTIYGIPGQAEAAEKVPFVIPGLTRDILQSLILSDCGSEAAMTIGKNMHFVSDLASEPQPPE